ncbi:MAG TPA: 1,4-alpha-glucan branching protein GlgB [bacterium]
MGARAAADPLCPADRDLRRLLAGRHHDPHRILGVHRAPGTPGDWIVRCFHPGAATAEVLVEGRPPLAMARVHEAGLFAARLAGGETPPVYRLRLGFPDGGSLERDDPYRFLPTVGELDLHLIGEGSHRRLWEVLGAHPRVLDGVAGVAFAVWAPNARRVSVVGEFNAWDGRVHAMRVLGGSGVWELFIPGIGEWALYRYEIAAADGALRLKTDPLAFAAELRPKTAGLVFEHGRYPWADAAWMAERAQRQPRSGPLAIYEVHLGSWMRSGGEAGEWLTYREIAPRLAEHVRRLGFTHVELLPVAEHPFDASWGYQVTGFYAPTSRFGTPDDFKFLVDTLHQAGIGVILDWVPGHFPRDDHSLRRFDGTALYEHEDPRLGEHPDWGTLIFNFGRNEVANFLLANALFWLEVFHVDALRVDAVASMLYLDYSRREGEWIPNRYGGRENLDAVAFLRRLNELVYALHDGCFTVAEESTAWPAVSLPTWLGGLGFGFKWNMGWMHDTLHYFHRDPVHRAHHHNELTFSMLYAYTENFVLPLSHDEVVHGKGSLLGKMPGDRWRQFANLRLLMAYHWTHPGKKLLFMGSELAPDREWDHDRGLEWHLAQDPPRAGVLRLIEDLGRLYRGTAALWELDHDPEGFAWIDCQDAAQSVVSFVRRDRSGGHVVVALNLTPVPRRAYRVGLPCAGPYREALNTDAALYGGGNLGNGGTVVPEPVAMHGFAQSAALTLPPLAAVVLQPLAG